MSQAQLGTSANIGDVRGVVVGQGSAGRRHRDILRSLGLSVRCVSRHAGDADFDSLQDALRSHKPEYVVVANETSRHHEALEELAASGIDPIVLVEKPLTDRTEHLPSMRPSATFVGYQMRFHPCVSELKRKLAGRKVLGGDFYVGQHLSQWRGNRPYRESYSARADMGGGALRDLSHELDLVRWLLGGWVRLAAQGGKLSDLEIDSDDLYAILIETPSGAIVTVKLNCLDHNLSRTIRVLTEETTFSADLISGRLCENGSESQFEPSMGSILCAQHRAAIMRDTRDLCSYEEGVCVLHMIEAIERAAREGRWVDNPQADKITAEHAAATEGSNRR